MRGLRHHNHHDRARAFAVAALALSFVSASGGCERLPTRPASPYRPPVKGVTLVDWSADGYGSAEAAAALDALAATGANTVALVVTAYQGNRLSNDIRSGDPRTPAFAAVRQAVERARDLDLRVSLKPHVDVDDGSWRGTIAPTDPAAWFASYRSFILPWAELARTTGAAQFVVGTELGGTLRHHGLWRETLRAVRGTFSGELVYAASWDEAGKVPFWDELDSVGVDFYFPVATRRNPGRLEILAGWQVWLDRLRILHRQTGRPILLTEIGYRSVDGAGMHPYDFGADATLDLQEQADLYWAALEATRDVPWLSGVYWWNWPADGSGGPDNLDFTPRGKLAVQEIQGAWQAR